MADHIDQKTVAHLADLARIKVTPEEAQKLVGELGGILGYVDALRKVDTSSIPHESPAGILRNVWREDVLHSDADPEAILDEAPMREGNYVAVKKVIDYGN